MHCHLSDHRLIHEMHQAAAHSVDAFGRKIVVRICCTKSFVKNPEPMRP